MRTYQVEVFVSKQEDGLWRAEVPALPGCFVDAGSLDEAMADIQEGIKLFIASYREHGDPLPKELTAVAEVAMPLNLKLLVSVP